MTFTRLLPLVLICGGLYSSLALAWEVTHEGHHVAHVGSSVRITLSYEKAPNKQIEGVKVFIDGKLISDPEITKAAGAATTPDHGEISFTYHPDKRGQHRVDLLPVILGRDGETHLYPPRVFLFLVL